MLPTVQQRGYISYVVTLECMCDMRFKSGSGVRS